jgi:hypothetical protein
MKVARDESNVEESTPVKFIVETTKTSAVGADVETAVRIKEDGERKSLTV